MMDSDGSNQLPLTKKGGWAPCWSPDGKMIAFISERSGENEIWLLNRKTGEEKQLTDDGEWKLDPAFFPDGKRIVYATFMGLRIVDIKKGSTRKLTVKGNMPSVSPDGKTVVFSRAGDVGGAPSLWLLRLATLKQEQLTKGTSEGDADPCFSPDGEIIAYSSKLPQPSSNLYLLILRHKKKIRITKNFLANREPAFSPDGKKVVYTSQKDGNDNIWVMDLKDLL